MMLGALFNKNPYRFPGPNPVMHYTDMHEIVRIEKKLRGIPQENLTLKEAHRLLYYVATETRYFLMDQLKQPKPKRFVHFEQQVQDYNINNFGRACVHAATFSGFLLEKMGVQDCYYAHSTHAGADQQHDFQHGFLIVRLPIYNKGKSKTLDFLIDTTYRQFFSTVEPDQQPSLSNRYMPTIPARGKPSKEMPGHKITQTESGRHLSNHLLKYGFCYFGLAARDAYLSSFISNWRIKAADRFTKNGKRTFPFFEDRAKETPNIHNDRYRIKEIVTESPLDRKLSSRRTPRAGYLFK